MTVHKDWSPRHGPKLDDQRLEYMNPPTQAAGTLKSPAETPGFHMILKSPMKMSTKPCMQTLSHLTHFVSFVSSPVTVTQ